jgi:hypothetical protein
LRAGEKAESPYFVGQGKSHDAKGKRGREISILRTVCVPAALGGRLAEKMFDEIYREGTGDRGLPRTRTAKYLVNKPFLEFNQTTNLKIVA